MQAERKQSARSAARQDSTQAARPQSPESRKKLSYMEAREYATLEERIAQAEQQLRAARQAAEDPPEISMKHPIAALFVILFLMFVAVVAYLS